LEKSHIELRKIIKVNIMDIGKMAKNMVKVYSLIQMKILIQAGGNMGNVKEKELIHFLRRE